MADFSNAAFIERVERKARARRAAVARLSQEQTLADVRELLAIEQMKQSKAYLMAGEKGKLEMHEKVYNHRLGRYI